MTAEKSNLRIVELFSKTFPELLDEYERCATERRENFLTENTGNTLMLVSIVVMFVLWFYTFYKLSIHAHELPVWFIVLGFIGLFVIPGGFVLVLPLTYLMLRQRSMGPNVYAKSRYQGYPPRSLYSRYSMR
jgi:hypothetical protein